MESNDGADRQNAHGQSGHGPAGDQEPLHALEMGQEQQISCPGFAKWQPDTLVGTGRVELDELPPHAALLTCRQSMVSWLRAVC